jgi:hypothetical protein
MLVPPAGDAMKIGPPADLEGEKDREGENVSEGWREEEKVEW